MNQFASGNCRALVLFRQKNQTWIPGPGREWSLTWKPAASLNPGILSILGIPSILGLPSTLGLPSVLGLLSILGLPSIQGPCSPELRRGSHSCKLPSSFQGGRESALRPA